MASENQANNRRITRLKLAKESNLSAMPEKADVGTMEGSNHLPGKRKADGNLTKQHHGVKRFALGNLTNAESDNLLAQNPQKASIPMAKIKQFNESKHAASKLRGATKILTRAAMRLEKAFSNKNKPQDEQENRWGDDRDNEKPSNVSDGAAKVGNATNGVMPTKSRRDTAHTGAENTKLSIARNQKPLAQVNDEATNSKNTAEVPSKIPLMLHSEKNVKQLGALDEKKGGRSSNDFEDNSLYVSAVENLDEDNNSSSSNVLEKTGAKGPLQTLNQPARCLKVKKNIATEKIPAVKNAPLEQVTKHPLISDSVTQEAANNNEHKPPPLLAGGINTKLKKQTSNEFELSNDALYVTAIDTLEEEAASSLRRPLAQPTVEQGNEISKQKRRCGTVIVPIQQSIQKPTVTVEPRSPRKKTPPGVNDFDKTYWRDVYQVSEYAQEIFEYLRDRESLYQLKDYMKKQPFLTAPMRALLVDWMVELQESFELNHETLYLAVKIVDAYLSLVVIGRETLQLVASAAFLIAAKYDERVPPTVDDFIYICDGAYVPQQLLEMERTVFRTIGFDLGFPLSYRFLRRYARVALVPMPILTLARYILETSLMEYATVILSDSKLACAALFIARRMSDLPGWNKTLEFYSGYKVDDLKSVIILLNNVIMPKKSSPLLKLTNVREKYSHELFFQVAKCPVITSLEKLFETSELPLNVDTKIGEPSSGRSAKSVENMIVVPQSNPQASGTSETVAPSTSESADKIDTEAQPSTNFP